MPDDEVGIWLGGTQYLLSDLTYKERREWRETVRELAHDNDLEAATEDDMVPAFVFVVKKRDDASFTLDQALEMKETDLAPPVEEKKRPPRKPASASAG